MWVHSFVSLITILLMERGQTTTQNVWLRICVLLCYFVFLNIVNGVHNVDPIDLLFNQHTTHYTIQPLPLVSRSELKPCILHLLLDDNKCNEILLKINFFFSFQVSVSSLYTNSFSQKTFNPAIQFVVAKVQNLSGCKYTT